MERNEFFTIREAVNAVNSRIISLLTANVKSQKLIGVSRGSMEGALKSINVAPNVLARRSNAMWDILLGTEQEAKQLTGCVLLTTSITPQTEYMDTRWTKITVHRVPVNICEDRMRAFFSKFRQMEEVNASISKTGITTGHMVLQVTLTR